MIDVDKVAIITGATSGIGRQAALELAASGHRVAIAGRNADALDALRKEIQAHGAEALACPGDVVEPTYWEEMVSEVAGHWGRIDVLVNNAAWRTVTPMDGTDLADWDKTIRICLTAPAFLAKLAADVMSNQKTGGTIVNISSIMASRPAGYSPAYVACKGALESLTYELAALYGPRHIRVVCVNPGNITTGMSSDYYDNEGNNISKRLEAEINEMTPLGRAGRSEEIAHLIAWLASDAASFITGTTVVADGGFSHNFNSYSSKKLQFPNEF